MVRNLVALRFNAGLHTVENKEKGWQKGHARYPDFNQVSPANRMDMDWCIYIDKYGIGMQYDKACGHKEVGDTPYGEQCCVIAVPQDFATEALSLFPDDLTQLTPAEFETFYNDKAHAHESPELVDKDVLEAISQKEKLSLPVPEKADALNPDNPARGIRKNQNKVFADFKKKVAVEIV
jgi:hypothetical protein